MVLGADQAYLGTPVLLARSCSMEVTDTEKLNKGRMIQGGFIHFSAALLPHRASLLSTVYL